MKKLYFTFSLIFTFFILSAAPSIFDRTLTTATISYASPFCTNSTLEYVTLTGTTGGIFSASSSGLVIDAASGNIQPNLSLPGSYTVTYYIAANGTDPAFSTTAAVTIVSYTQPQFSFATFTYCPNSAVPVLPNVSSNGITGTWNPPVIDNQTLGVSTYLFTPDSGQCSFPFYLTIQIGGNIQPAFFFSNYSFCAGSVPILPTTSDNGIHGSWNPPQITADGIYTFTPDPAQCATTLVETFSVEPLPVATLSASQPVCQYGPNPVIGVAATPNSTVTYSVNGGANQVIAVGSTGTANLTFTSTVATTTTVCLVSVSHGNCTAAALACATATVIPYLNLASIPSVSVCTSYTLPALAQGNYYTGSNGTGTMLHAGDIISNTQTIYVYAQNQCGSDEEYFYVFVYPIPIITPMPDVTACGFYSLPPNNEANYYSYPNGGGVPLSGNLYGSQTVYLYAQSSSECYAQDSFQLTVIPVEYPIIATQNNINYIYVDGTTVVQPLLLDSQLQGNYSYQWFELDDAIPAATSSTYLLNMHMDGLWHYLSVHATDNATGCMTASPMFQVYETPVPAPGGNATQTFTPGQTLGRPCCSGKQHPMV